MIGAYFSNDVCRQFVDYVPIPILPIWFCKYKEWSTKITWLMTWDWDITTPIKITELVHVEDVLKVFLFAVNKIDSR